MALRLISSALSGFKILLLDEAFSALSLSAKVLYSVLLDRMGLSMKNKWLIFDKARCTLSYQITEIQVTWDSLKEKSNGLSLTELEKIGLIEKRLWIAEHYIC